MDTCAREGRDQRTVRFQLGLVVATQGAVRALSRGRESHTGFIARHQSGDWGEVCPEDGRLNEAAVAHEGDPERQQRVLSVYRTHLGDVIWIITEHDRSVTTLLTPDEY